VTCSPGGRAAAGLRLGATIAALVAGEIVLWWAGRVLPAFPLDTAGLVRTFGEAEPLPLAISLLRLAAFVVGAGLLATTALAVVARCWGARRLVVQVDRCTPPSIRRMLDGALGVGLAASIGLGAIPAGADAGGSAPPATATLRRLADVPSPSTIRRLPDGPPPPVTERSPPFAAPVAGSATTLRRLPDSLPEPPADAPAPPAAPIPAPAVAPGRSEVVVKPGDSFWRLAERHEARRLGRQPSEAEVGACWQELVAVNRHRLAVPDNPDLLFPGQVLSLPCP